MHRYCIAMRPELQKQVQEELHTAGIDVTATVTATNPVNESGSDAHADAVPQKDQTVTQSTACAKDQTVTQNTACVKLSGMATTERLAQRRDALGAVFAQQGPDVLKQLPLLTACLNEAMRIYPAGAPGAPRCDKLCCIAVHTPSCCCGHLLHQPICLCFLLTPLHWMATALCCPGKAVPRFHLSYGFRALHSALLLSFPPTMPPASCCLNPLPLL